MIIAALMLALAFVMPLLTGQIPQIGAMLCPMHIPVILCGFICGWPYALFVGAVVPLFRSFVVGMPPIYPSAVGMAFELATYGTVSGIMYGALKKASKLTHVLAIYISLITAMCAGRVVWGVARYFMAVLSSNEFGIKVFIAGAVTNAIPGIISQLVLVPLIVTALEKAHLIDGKNV